jgi:VWFA-related protein
LRRTLTTIFASAVVFTLACAAAGQVPKSTPSPTPSPQPKADEQESVKVFTEEVRLPVIAKDQFGHYDPTLTTDDVLVLEDGKAQQIKSVRHIPANIVLILDTGGESSGLGELSKKTSTTAAVARKVVSRLAEGDRIAVLQSGNKAELIQPWTDDADEVIHALRWKLGSGKRSRLSDAMVMAAELLADRPEGSRHIVLITDGVETPGGKVKLEDALKQLAAARATVHVISYTTFVRQSSDHRDVKLVTKNNPIAGDPVITNDPTLPPGTNRGGPTFGVGVTFDPAMRKRRKAYEAETKKSEKWLTALAEETGGTIFLPTSTDQMIAQGEEAAREIGAEYVVTYRPTRPLADARPGEYRRIEVASRRVGLYLRSRRGYVVPNPQ